MTKKFGYPYLCECPSTKFEQIPNEYSEEFFSLSDNPRWIEKKAYIILKTCPTYPSVQDKILDTTKHLALIAKAYQRD